jgi:hypothetical protein
MGQLIRFEIEIDPNQLSPRAALKDIEKMLSD